MRRITHWCCCSLLSLLAAPGAEAQGLGWGAAGLATLSSDRSAVGGIAHAIVQPYERLRFAGGVAGLVDLSEGDHVVGRAEALAQFHVTPYALTAWGLYAAAGLAYEVAERERGVARLVFTLGAERSPGAPRSLFVEAGFGGGWRLAAGFRVRPRGRR